ncbi:MAG: hypothetical protein V4515_08285 [Chloroflexota bacterium]
MSAATALGASFLAVLAHPRWWVMSLAAFLVRGGLLLLLLPLIPLPSTAALANALGPTLVGFVFGGPSASFLILVGSIVAATVLWFVLAAIAGTILDLALIREAAEEDDLDGRARPADGGPWRAITVRWLAHLPTAAAVVWGAAALVDAAYVELIRPGDPSVPVALRVLLRAPQIVGLVVVAWAVGEAVGGLAVRHLAWGAGIPRSLAGSVLGVLKPSGLAVLVLTNLGLVAAIAGGGLAIGIAFEHARVLLIDGGAPLDQGLALVLLSGSWFGTAVLVSIATAWRATAWTYEAGRHRALVTIGPGAA